MGTNPNRHEDTYKRISEKDEGNIGGTLSNAHLKSTIDPSGIMHLDEALE